MNQEGTYSWIQDRLRDLRSGTISESDLARLDEIAKNDPFVHDALEGYKSHSHHDHSVNLNLLSHRIRNKGVAKRRKLLPTKSNWIVQAVAASLVLVLVTWAVFYYVGKERTAIFVAKDDNLESKAEDNQDAKSEIKAEAESNAQDDAIAEGTSIEETGLRANAQKHIETAKSTSREKVEEKDIAVTDETGNEPENYTFGNPVSPPAAPLSTKENSGVVLETKRGDDSGVLQDTDQSTAKYDEGYYANQMSPAMMAQRVTGQVINTYGQPIQGAFLAVPNSNLITTSNQYGQFELYLPDKGSVVEVSSTGYTDTIVNVSQEHEDVVIMLADQKLMSSAEMARSKSSQPASAQAGAMEQNATISLLDYLKSKSRFPIEEQLSRTSKEVIVEFDVKSNGRPEKVRSVSFAVDKKYINEAIRLIENGPDWSCDDEKVTCTKRYTIYFK
ncbi:MAG TPA: carboxypeptidase-like regulatory domain-containing protein [Saprospiraceae bacterium]|nr:carboxypeptidase-like regulatory domain-containing protein [Saprospiraceae bacterium]